MTESLISKVSCPGVQNEAIPTTEYTISVCTHFSTLKLLQPTKSEEVFYAVRDNSKKPMICGMGMKRFNLLYTV
ncbi:hypothetical protein VN97_g3396 [Penicillium thymicola]|uniref:Uncharacterized protein n=1 Tax=Penicillium thymicola TaxID=293382 RepID=A0AAI9TM88_PENTH|nr:hypothetical protein VN97_g3396 [Penicillium thymicola]